MNRLRQEGLTKEIGIAPGPANGFVPDLVQTFENFGHLIDWAMVILNPLEPWPASFVLDAADRFDVKVITRVLDHGGVFYDELKPYHEFKPGDHRAYRPEGWVKRGYDFVERIRPMAEAHNLTPLQYAANWNLSHSAVKAVIPAFVQEPGENARSIESKIEEMANLPIVDLDQREIDTVRELGDNTDCMLLKGASLRHTTSERCDEWPMRPDLMEICEAYDLAPSDKHPSRLSPRIFSPRSPDSVNPPSQSTSRSSRSPKTSSTGSMWHHSMPSQINADTIWKRSSIASASCFKAEPFVGFGRPCSLPN